MSVKAVVVCGVVMASLAAVQPAAAQYYPPAEYVMSPYAVHATLRAHGMRPITQPIQTGAYVVVRAVDETGEIVRVLINARYGNIIQVIPLPPMSVVGQPAYGRYGPPPPAGAYPPPPPRYGAARPDLKVEPGPQGGPDPYEGYNAVEQPQGAMPPQAAAVPPPPRTPMPRPRPSATIAAGAKTAAAAPAAKTDAVEPAAKPAPATTGAATKPQAFPPATPLE